MEFYEIETHFQWNVIQWNLITRACRIKLIKRVLSRICF